MSGALPTLQPGQTCRLTASQMESLQLSCSSPERDGSGTSKLPAYARYNFTWFTTSDTSTKTHLIYHLTMHKRDALPPLNVPTILVGNQLIGLAIDSNGRSTRPDLQNYHFETAYQGITAKSEAIYTVTMRKA